MSFLEAERETAMTERKAPLICPACGGSGITRVGIVDKLYTLPVACGGCRGTGVLQAEPEDTAPLYDRMIKKAVEIEMEIEEERYLPPAVKRRWCERLESVGFNRPDAEAALRALKREIADSEEEFIDSYLSLITCGIGDLADMCAEYRRQRTA